MCRKLKSFRAWTASPDTQYGFVLCQSKSLKEIASRIIIEWDPYINPQYNHADDLFYSTDSHVIRRRFAPNW